METVAAGAGHGTVIFREKDWVILETKHAGLVLYHKGISHAGYFKRCKNCSPTECKPPSCIKTMFELMSM